MYGAVRVGCPQALDSYISSPACSSNLYRPRVHTYYKGVLQYVTLIPSSMTAFDRQVGYLGGGSVSELRHNHSHQISLSGGSLLVKGSTKEIEMLCFTCNLFEVSCKCAMIPSSSTEKVVSPARASTGLHPHILDTGYLVWRYR